MFSSIRNYEFASYREKKRVISILIETREPKLSSVDIDKLFRYNSTATRYRGYTNYYLVSHESVTLEAVTSHSAASALRFRFFG